MNRIVNLALMVLGMMLAPSPHDVCDVTPDSPFKSGTVDSRS